MIFKALLAALLSTFLTTGLSYGEKNYLLYFEAQGVTGYSSREDKVIFYSKAQQEVMQKPSVGFDYVQRLSKDSVDFGALAVQARLAYDRQDDKKDIEPQLYNAYLKLKFGQTDVWLGHNRPALGLSSYFDSHGLLLDTLAMNNFGFDRDWGAAVFRNFPWGDINFSLTTGTGMPVYFKGNHLISGRISKGILSQENYNLGFSLSYGETLMVMGYDLLDAEPKRFAVAGVDLAYFRDNLENRFEVMAGKNRDENSYALFWRFGINLLEEGRLKLEAQPVFLKIGPENGYQISLGLSFLATKDLTLRTMYHYDDLRDDHRAVLQLYYYRRI